ncbi:free fatty acid receptor 2-like [Alligator sinensis]|uniref:Free fatty acid receptor 1 n=1 Tax=Alligator sinensis TaxID=38654 RepID=A0A3Q0HNS4_ALLSI|nr:free fatty acid receptor 2-like [Alligator sinensis]
MAFPFKSLVLFVYIFTFLTGLPANLFAFVTFMRQIQHQSNPVAVLLLNLTVSDLLLLLFLPFKMAEAAADMNWPLPGFLCTLTNYFYYSSIYTSTFLLTAVSVERYLGVAFPVQYKLRRRPAYAMVTSVAVWVLAGAHSGIVFISEVQTPGTNITRANVSRCYEDFTTEQLQVVLPVRLEVFLVLFCLPFTVTLFCYVNFVRILLALPNIPRRKKCRAVGLALATLANFMVCFAPYNISHVVGFVENKSIQWRVYALLLSTLNASLDPVIFYFSSSAVQKALVGSWLVLGKRLHAMAPLCYCLHGGREDQVGNRDKVEVEGSST